MSSKSRIAATLFIFGHAARLNALPVAQSQTGAGETPAFIPSYEIPRPDNIYETNTFPENPPDSSGNLRGSTGLIGHGGGSAPYAPGDNVPVSQIQLAPGQDADENLGLYLDISDIDNPQPIRGEEDAPTDPGPRTQEYDKLNSDIFIPPGTDSGDVPNAKWPLGLSHNRHGMQGAGWARQQNVDEMPVATAMAGVDMYLSPFAYRELHWHKQDEWSYILNGSVRIATSNENGETFVDDLQAGDVWFFPAGVPHSIQALANGSEFLLIFDDGEFSEDNTFLVSELFERNPRSVLAKNFRTDVSAFDNIPDGQLYIFPGTPPPEDIQAQNVTGPNGVLPPDRQYSYHLSQQEPLSVPGGNVKIIDPTTFPIAESFSVAVVTIEPGAMRELHWHTRSDEWNYFVAGSARATIFSAPDAGRTFDFTAGDTGYVPVDDAHYVENTGDAPVVYLEVLQQPVYSDISVAQWLGLTPQQVVKDHLHLPDDVVDNLPKTKQYIVPGDTNLLQTNFTESK